MKTRSVALWLGLLLLIAPALFTLSGCSGGSSGPTVGNGSLNGLSVAFGNGQIGELDLEPASGTVTSTLRVNPPPGSAANATDFSASAIQVMIPAGVYTGTGTIDGSGEFRVEFSPQVDSNRLIISGRVPTRSQGGRYTVSIGSQAFEGTFPALSSASPTPTAVPTATPTSAPV